MAGHPPGERTLNDNDITPTGNLDSQDDQEDATIVDPAARRNLFQQLVDRFTLTVIEGSGSGHTIESKGQTCSIGQHALNDLVLDDATVSRFHCEIRVDDDGARVIDLNSRNGTLVDGVQVREAFLRGGSTLRLGRAVVRFNYDTEQNRLPLSKQSRFGSLVGTSTAMRQAFALLERAANSDATVLLEGETGTGKGKAAEAVHEQSQRAGGPFLVVDCSAIPTNLLASELFGHEKGSFTGAHDRRVGAFEEAEGGTIFLDEVGELPADLQPNLLRVLEERQIKRVGSNRHIPVDVRLIAATNRDLRAEVNAGKFRSDLYYRLAVVKVQLPPLRARPDDVPLIVEAILERLGGGEQARARLADPAVMSAFKGGNWPGNVRELRNTIERCLVFEDIIPLPAMPTEGGRGRTAPVTEPATEPEPWESIVSYQEARRTAIRSFERRYLTRLLERFDGKVSNAAEAAGVERASLYRLLRRHGIKPSR